MKERTDYESKRTLFDYYFRTFYCYWLANNVVRLLSSLKELWACSLDRGNNLHDDNHAS